MGKAAPVRALATVPPRLSSPTGQSVIRLCGRRSLNPLDIKTPPPGLNEIALAEWHRLAGELSGIDAVATIDRNILAAYCVCFARWREAEAKAAELGLVVKGPTGAATQNPFLSVADRCIRQLTEIGRELGLSPAARGELRRPPR
jgi:P27 family predicted phage terminase small subunit